jgi:hypothetical protein
MTTLQEIAIRRLVRRAMIGIEVLPAEKRLELLEDAALMLPPVEAEFANAAAFALRKSIDLQDDFLSKLS